MLRDGHVMQRSVYYGLVVVGGFAVLGAGLGLAANFTLGFFIRQFVEPGESPMDVTQVAILFLVAIFFVYTLGPLAAGVAGVAIGRALPDRELLAGTIVGVGSFLGYFLFVGLALFFTFTVLVQYGPPPGGGAGGDGGPLDPADLATLMLQVSLPTGLVGLATAYLTSRLGAARE